MIEKAIEAAERGLIGMPTWGAQRTLGSFLTVEFGSITNRERVPRGAWHLWLCGTQWEVYRDGDLVFTSDDDPDVIDCRVHILSDRTVAGVLIGAEFRIELSDGVAIQSRAECVSGLDRWMLFTPYNIVLFANEGGEVSTEKTGASD